ncbi:hypothetical protein JO861_12340 [Rhodococcus hoagii]|uniref:hypothetical protein n=1 Tax=Rhodococcus hoagii TaxID=43767 RepID=UPI0019632546|nr:hypothetical protein [Prescottella equi]MBM9837343.1 hypothetical protein [Prescottella equi]
MASKIDLSAVSRESVLDAVAEFDSLGQGEFLRRRGFKTAKSYRLVHGARFYDSKAIVGVAHGYATGDFIDHTGFSGGLATVAGCLSELGFIVDHGAKNASGGLLWELETNTPVFTGNGKSAAYKYVVLLWAVVREGRSPNPVAFSTVRKELADYLAPFAVADSQPDPVDPWVALRKSGWWTLHIPEGFDGESVTNRQAKSLTRSEDLKAGLSLAVRSLLKNDVWRAEATAVLLRRIDELVGPAHR